MSLLASGEIPKLPLNLALVKNITLHGGGGVSELDPELESALLSNFEAESACTLLSI